MRQTVWIAALMLGLCLPSAARAETAVPQTREEITLSFAPVVKKAAPAVVNIYTRKIVERRRSPFAGDPFFERFFGDFFPDVTGPRRRIENSLGSGVILDAAGIVVSNNHVVGDADEITVVLQDRREFDAEVIFTDKEADLAVLRLEDAEDLPVLELRDSDRLEVGDLVLAIGNPFGVGQTVSSGIISGLARSGGSRGRGGGYFIQTDAAINPGNSGGALVDMTGRLVGINTAILTRSGGSNGIGFAVPANLVARVVEAAKSGATMLDRPWLGLDGQAVTGELAEALGLRRPAGVLVEQVHRDSAFAAAGIRPGDVLTMMRDEPVNSPAELAFRAATLGAGREVEVAFIRRGEPGRAEVRLETAPDRPDRDRRVLERAGRLSGLDVVNINPAVIEEAGLPLSAEGVLVVGLRGPARRTGLKPGDLILKVNGREVASTADLQAALPSRGEVLLEVERGGRLGSVAIRG